LDLFFYYIQSYPEDRPQEVKFATCSADKARKLLGYRTQTSLKDGLQDMIDYIKKKGPKKFRYHLECEIVNEKTPKTWKDKLF
jgi:UDP-glucose 4-epimerase